MRSNGIHAVALSFFDKLFYFLHSTTLNTEHIYSLDY